MKRRVKRKPQGFGRNQRVRQRMAPQPDRNFPRPERPGNRMNPMAKQRVQRGGTGIAPGRNPRPQPPGFPARPTPVRPAPQPGYHPNYDPVRNGEDRDAGTFDTSGLPRQGSPAWNRMFSGFDNLGRPVPRNPNDGVWQQVVQQNQPAPIAPIFGGGAGEMQVPPGTFPTAAATQVPQAPPAPLPVAQPPPLPGLQSPQVAPAPLSQPAPVQPPPQMQTMAQPQAAPSVPSTAPQSPQMASNVRSPWGNPPGMLPQSPAPQAPAPQPAQQGNTLPPWGNPPPMPGASQDLFPGHTKAWERANPEAVAQRRARLAQQGQPAPQPQPTAPPPVNDQNPGADANSLLLNPQYEQGVRALDDELSATLAQIGVSRQEAQGINQLIKERLGLQKGEDLSTTDESMSERGIFNSGVRTTNRNLVEGDYRRRFEDTDLDFARTLRDLSSGEIGARSGYSKGLAELLTGVANSMAEENNAPIGMPTSPRTPARKKKSTGGKPPRKPSPKRKPSKKRVRQKPGPRTRRKAPSKKPKGRVQRRKRR